MNFKIQPRSERSREIGIWRAKIRVLRDGKFVRATLDAPEFNRRADALAHARVKATEIVAELRANGTEAVAG